MILSHNDRLRSLESLREMIVRGDIEKGSHILMVGGEIFDTCRDESLTCSVL